MPLPAVRENTESIDGDGDGNSASSRSAASIVATVVDEVLDPTPKPLKRSPYLSQMTHTANTDLMFQLSQPGKEDEEKTVTGGGKKVGGDFFMLRRSNAGGMSHEQQHQQQLQQQGSLNRPRPPSSSQSHIPSAVRSMRSGHSASALRSCLGHHESNNELKKNSSVTFSQTTKQGSTLGLSAMNMANAAGVHQVPPNEKHRHSLDSASGDSSAKNQFPFYFDTMDAHSIPPEEDGATTNSMHSGDQRRLSKSSGTLQYYYKPLLKSSPQTHIFSKSLRNITFREMLDEGDGKEGDLNLRLRNEQWKVFRSSSVNTDEGDDVGGVAKSVASMTMENRMSGSLLGMKRTLTPTSSNNNSTEDVGGANTSDRNSSVTEEPIMTMQDHPQLTLPNQQHFIGAHRGCVSAYDLAVFRRSASRMKMTPSQAPSTSANWIEMSPQQQQPGEVLGASMLSRLSEHSGSSAPSTSGFASATVGKGAQNNTPLAQMMAKKFNMSMPPSMTKQHPAVPLSSLMGRRVHTVSAGLAYGSAGFQMDAVTRLSRFDLGKADTSALSISSGGGGGSGYGKNEEW